MLQYTKITGVPGHTHWTHVMITSGDGEFAPFMLLPIGQVVLTKEKPKVVLIYDDEGNDVVMQAPISNCTFVVETEVVVGLPEF